MNAERYNTPLPEIEGEVDHLAKKGFFSHSSH
jgi:hypothetical protein